MSARREYSASARKSGRMSACQMIVHRRRDDGIMGKGTHSFRLDAEPCGREADETGMCSKHRAQAAKYAEANRQRREARP